MEDLDTVQEVRAIGIEFKNSDNNRIIGVLENKLPIILDLITAQKREDVFIRISDADGSEHIFKLDRLEGFTVFPAGEGFCDGHCHDDDDK